MENKKITSKEIEEVYNKLYEKGANQNRKIILWQGCKTNGAVERSASNLNLCSDPDCYSCNTYHKLLKEESKKFLHKDWLLDKDWMKEPKDFNDEK